MRDGDTLPASARAETTRVPDVDLGWRRFAVAFLLVGVVGGLLVLLFERVPAMARCRASATPDTFLATCASTGEYDHAAYAFGLEPGILDAVKAAKIVFLGNSRAQFAFSTRAVADRFLGADEKAYRLGFGGGEYSPFALDILTSAGAKPRLAIVNADPFFSDRRSPFAQRIIDDKGRAWVAGLRSRFAASFIAEACARISPRFLCRGRKSAIYRIRADGAWSWQGTYFPRAVGTLIDDKPGRRFDLPTGAAERGLAFLEAIGLPAACMVITAVPNSTIDTDAAATALSAKMGAPLVLPRVAGLRTLDGSHLDADSAERWSTAFLKDLEPILRRCV